MNIPISYRLPRLPGLKNDIYATWFAENDVLHRMSYDWVSCIVTFECEDDAIAFQLAFGIPRHYTPVEKMIENENSNN